MTHCTAPCRHHFALEHIPALHKDFPGPTSRAYHLLCPVCPLFSARCSHHRRRRHHLLLHRRLLLHDRAAPFQLGQRAHAPVGRCLACLRGACLPTPTAATATTPASNIAHVFVFCYTVCEKISRVHQRQFVGKGHPRGVPAPLCARRGRPPPGFRHLGERRQAAGVLHYIRTFSHCSIFIASFTHLRLCLLTCSQMGEISMMPECVATPLPHTLLSPFPKTHAFPPLDLFRTLGQFCG